MKLGIFGDSFAWSRESHSFAWYKLLAKRLGASVKSHGMSGSSTFYTYYAFLEHHKNYDINIVIITQFSRYTKPFYFESSGLGPMWLPSIKSIDNLLIDSTITQAEREELNQLKTWYIISDDNFMKAAQDLMVAEILRTRPDVIIIPGFNAENSLSKERKQNLGIDDCGNCWKFVEIQYMSLGITEKLNDIIEENRHNIACHFTPEGNEVFSQAVYNKIKYNIPIVCPQEIIHNHTFNYYYTIKS